MKKFISLMVCSMFIMFFGGGCILSDLFGVDSPRPKEYQVEASKEITTTSVTEIMKGQLEKQDGIEAVAIAAIVAMEKADTKYKAAAITNIVANTANDIRRADGSAKLLSELAGKSNKSITEMSAMEYMSYVAGQSALAMGNREKLSHGIEAGFEWTKSMTGMLAGGIPAGGTLLALLVGYMRRGKTLTNKDDLLKRTGNAINDFTTINKDAGGELKKLVAKKTSSVPLDVNKEFGIN